MAAVSVDVEEDEVASGWGLGGGFLRRRWVSSLYSLMRMERRAGVSSEELEAWDWERVERPAGWGSSVGFSESDGKTAEVSEW